MESGPPEESALELQAVDAGTGGELTDDSLTVRYLVRSPITVDATAVDRVSATDPYRIRQEISGDSLVVEVRLEAESYHRLDTVLAVARGGSAGPFTIRMARRLGRRAEAERPTARPPAQANRPAPAPSESRPTSSSTPGDGIDRTAMRAGDRAFQRDDWSGARTAYQRMERPPDRTGSYAREYQAARVRQGISHIELGEWGAAMESLQEAVSLGSPSPSTYLYLSRAQCKVGRVDAGRQTLSRLRRSSTIPAGDRPAVLALAGYYGALCSRQEFETAEGTMNLLTSGTRTIKELEGFMEQADALSPVPPEVARAVADARVQADSIRARLRQLGHGDR